LPGTEVESFAKLLADDLKGRSDDGVVSGRPGSLLTGFDGLEIDRNGCGRLHDGGG